MDKDLTFTGIDLALVLGVPKEDAPDRAPMKDTHYRVFYCTGPVAGDIGWELPDSMKSFKLVSGGGNTKC